MEEDTVIDISASGVSNCPGHRVRQSNGDGNPLGRVVIDQEKSHKTWDYQACAADAQQPA